MLQQFGYIYKNYSNNIILIHTKHLKILPSYIDFNKSAILNFLNEHVNECNICFINNPDLLSGCSYCNFYMCADCFKHNINNNNICYQCGKEHKINEIKNIDPIELKKMLTGLLKKHKDFIFRETYQY